MGNKQGSGTNNGFFRLLIFEKKVLDNFLFFGKYVFTLVSLLTKPNPSL